MDRTTLVMAILALASYQLFVTMRVLLSRQYSLAQRLIQVALIWALPFLGAILCHVFLTTDRASHQKRDTAFISDGGDNPPGSAPGGPN